MIGYRVELNRKLQISVSVNYAKLRNHPGKKIECSNNDLCGEKRGKEKLKEKITTHNNNNHTVSND